MSGWWDGKEEFDWKKIIGGFSAGDLKAPDERYERGKFLLEDFAKEGEC